MVKTLVIFFVLCCHLLSSIRAQDTATGSSTTRCQFGDCPPIELFRACADGSPGYQCVLVDGKCVAQTTYCPVFPVPCSNQSNCNSSQFCSKTTCQNATGECRYVYEVCTAIYAPVCGCDGNTYSSRCEAQRARVDVASDGSCDGSRCSDNSECGSSSFCSKSSGCRSDGTCQPRPEICFDLFSPVCGCDGNTYPNSCYAQRNGVVVDHQGECASPSPSPSSSPCTPESCGPRPGLASRLCPDNKTIEGYTDRCLPSSDGKTCAWEYITCPPPTTSQCKFAECQPPEGSYPCADGTPSYTCVRDPDSGACVPQAIQCNVYCTSDSQCSAGSFCHKETGCQASEGKCERYEGIMCPAIYAPVCGCDGNTYASACQAMIARQNVAYDGQCGDRSPPLNSRICINKEECGEGSYCQKMTCRAIYGRCAPLRTSANPCASSSSSPVCGCDSVLYSSPCHAAETGVNIDININACIRFRSKRSRR